jgi:hypothetical protein
MTEVKKVSFTTTSGNEVKIVSFNTVEGDTVEISSTKSTYLEQPYTTKFHITLSDGNTKDFWSYRYIDLDSIGPFEFGKNNVWGYLESIKDELYGSEATAQMAYNNKKFNKSLVVPN